MATKNITININVKNLNKVITFSYEYDNITYFKERGKLLERRTYDNIQDISGNLLLLVGKFSRITIEGKDYKLIECSLRESNEHKYIELILEHMQNIKEGILKPSDNHIWNDETKTWELDFNKLVSNKRNEFKSIREKKNSENIEVDGALYQVKDQDLQKFFLKKVEVDLHPELREKKEPWILADNTIKLIDFNDIEKILAAYGNRQRDLFYNFNILCEKLKNATTEDEINKIQWL